MKKALYLVLHDHEYSLSPYPFWYEPTKAKPFPDTQKVADALKIDFEPDKNETIDIISIKLDETPKLTEKVGSRSKPVSLWPQE